MISSQKRPQLSRTCTNVAHLSSSIAKKRLSDWRDDDCHVPA